MAVETTNDAHDGSSTRYFTRSSIPGNVMRKKWNFDEDIYYNEPEWLPGDDEQPEDLEISDIYDYCLPRTQKSVEKKIPAKPLLVPLINITRCAYLTHVPGIQGSDLELLNKWYQKFWRSINTADFNYTNLSEEIKNDILYSYKNPVKIQMYLGAQRILYTTNSSIDDEYKQEGSEHLSKSPKFRHFFSLALKNPVSLNSLIIMTNCISMMEETLRDHDAQLIIADVLLSCYPCALENFVKLDGVTHIKTYLDYLASSSVLDAHINYLLKCFNLLGQINITLDVLKQSKIGIPVNIIASGKNNPKGTVQYECSDIGVKVKAADLIKKWKSIRDEAIQKPVRPISKVTSNCNANKSVSGEVKSVDFASSAKNNKSVNDEGKGSFVLNILDTLVEEHEKGRKRKQELRNAHKSSDFKMSSSGNKSEKKAKKTIANKTPLSDTIVYQDKGPNCDKFPVYNYQNNATNIPGNGVAVLQTPTANLSHNSSSVDYFFTKPSQHVTSVVGNTVQNVNMQFVPPMMNYNGTVNSHVNYQPGIDSSSADNEGSETAKVQSLLNFFRTNEANKMGYQQ